MRRTCSKILRHLYHMISTMETMDVIWRYFPSNGMTPISTPPARSQIYSLCRVSSITGSRFLSGYPRLSRAFRALDRTYHYINTIEVKCDRKNFPQPLQESFLQRHSFSLDDACNSVNNELVLRISLNLLSCPFSRQWMHRFTPRWTNNTSIKSTNDSPCDPSSSIVPS